MIQPERFVVTRPGFGNSVIADIHHGFEANQAQQCIQILED